MGMSTHVIGFKPPDEKWKKMKAIYDACKSAGIDVPNEVEKFFEWGAPDRHGVRIAEEAMVACGAIRDFRDDSREGFEVDIKKIPADVTVIRFYNSY